MKKAIKLFTVLLVAFTILFCSCTSSIERKAKKEMKRKMTKVAKIPKSVKITNLNTVYVDDSLCILHYDFEGKNSYGVPVKNKEEFVYWISDDGIFAYYNDIDEGKSVLELAKDRYQENEPYLKQEILDSKEKTEEYKKLCLEVEAHFNCLINGYEVGKQDDDSDYDMSNW